MLAHVARPTFRTRAHGEGSSSPSRLVFRSSGATAEELPRAVLSRVAAPAISSTAVDLIIPSLVIHCEVEQLPPGAWETTLPCNLPQLSRDFPVMFAVRTLGGR
jgi:hypothetical protein